MAATAQALLRYATLVYSAVACGSVANEHTSLTLPARDSQRAPRVLVLRACARAHAPQPGSAPGAHNNLACCNGDNVMLLRCV